MSFCKTDVVPEQAYTHVFFAQTFRQKTIYKQEWALQCKNMLSVNLQLSIYRCCFQYNCHGCLELLVFYPELNHATFTNYVRNYIFYKTLFGLFYIKAYITLQ